MTLTRKIKQPVYGNWQYCEKVKKNTDFITFVKLGIGCGYEFVNLGAPVSLRKIFASK
jgi:hypothetical protein